MKQFISSLHSPEVNQVIRNATCILRKGVVGPTPRFTDNKNGTVTDNLTGLVWLKDANSFGTKTWNDAVCCAGMLAAGMYGLLDGSAVGDWRLPSCQELQSLIDSSQHNPVLPDGHPFNNVQSNDYWTSTANSINDDYAWYVLLYNGSVSNSNKNYDRYVWPVRGCQAV